MTPEEIAEKHMPLHTTCPAKRRKILWQREQLVIDIKLHYIYMSEKVQGNFIEKK